MFDNLSNAFSFMDGSMRVGKFSTVESIVVAAANVFIYIAFGLSFVALAFSFIQFTTSSGDKVAIEKAQKSMLWAGIGMFGSLLALALKTVLIKTLGVSGMY